MASLTQWTWVSVNSGSWWWTGRPGVLRFMGSQRVGHDWATDLIWMMNELKDRNMQASGWSRERVFYRPLWVKWACSSVVPMLCRSSCEKDLEQKLQMKEISLWQRDALGTNLMLTCDSRYLSYLSPVFVFTWKWTFWDYLHLVSLEPMPVLLPWKSHGLRSLVGCSPWGHEELDTTEWLHFHFSLSCIGEGNGNPLQCSCLENPRDGGVWWAAVYRVAQSWTRLKWLSPRSSSSSSSVIGKTK